MTMNAHSVMPQFVWGMTERLYLSGDATPCGSAPLDRLLCCCQRPWTLSSKVHCRHSKRVRVGCPGVEEGERTPLETSCKLTPPARVRLHPDVVRHTAATQVCWGRPRGLDEPVTGGEYWLRRRRCFDRRGNNRRRLRPCACARNIRGEYLKGVGIAS